MKATGIVRRIDDLGRVVIPKEIRRTMRIREGDPLEIFTAKDGELIFKKYSLFTDIYYKDLVALFKSSWKNVIFVLSDLNWIVGIRMIAKMLAKLAARSVKLLAESLAVSCLADLVHLFHNEISRALGALDHILRL